MEKISKAPGFIERNITRDSSPWCVDGRPDFDSPNKGPQMLGGSFNPLIVHAIFENLSFNAVLIRNDLGTLKKNGFGIGVHRGEHKDSVINKSDCGAADKMKSILETALSSKNLITNELLKVYRANKAEFTKLGIDTKTFSKAFDTLRIYGNNKIEIDGETAITEAENAGANVVNLTGNHNEQVAFVNLKEGTSLDTNEFNRTNQQAFNLDLLVVMEQSKALGVDSKFAAALSLILYSATKIVLDKKDLSVQIHT